MEVSNIFSTSKYLSPNQSAASRSPLRPTRFASTMSASPSAAGPGFVAVRLIPDRTFNACPDRYVSSGYRIQPSVSLLGPRARTEKLLAELAKQGEILDDAQRTRLYAPVGVDTGADSPEEIALSIAAEILAVRNGRPAASLRDRRGPIHAAVPS